ncbi:hypothetical protein Trydic_g13713 [Trypoxylus dichotomus]
MPTCGPGVTLDLSLLHIAVQGVVHAAVYSLTGAATGRDKTVCQRACASRAELSALLGLPNDEMVRKCSFEKRLLTILGYKKEWMRESPIYVLKANPLNSMQILEDNGTIP